MERFDLWLYMVLFSNWKSRFTKDESYLRLFFFLTLNRTKEMLYREVYFHYYYERRNGLKTVVGVMLLQFQIW